MILREKTLREIVGPIGPESIEVMSRKRSVLSCWWWSYLGWRSWVKAMTHRIWSNYSDLTRPHPKWWLSKGNPLISGKPRLVKYHNLAR